MHWCIKRCAITRCLSYLYTVWSSYFYADHWSGGMMCGRCPCYKLPLQTLQLHHFKWIEYSVLPNLCKAMLYTVRKKASNPGHWNRCWWVVIELYQSTMWQVFLCWVVTGTQNIGNDSNRYRPPHVIAEDCRCIFGKTKILLLYALSYKKYVS